MRALRPADLQTLPTDELRLLVLTSRPGPGSVRTSWWLGLVEQMIAELGRGGGAASLRRAIDVIGVLDESADLPPSGPAALMVDLGLAGRSAAPADPLPAELMPDSLARRCIAAIRVDRLAVPDLIRREREYLVDGLGQADLPDREFAEFDRLDELRSIVRALRQVREGISDPEVGARVDEWLALDPLLCDAADDPAGRGPDQPG